METKEGATGWQPPRVMNDADEGTEKRRAQVCTRNRLEPDRVVP